MWLLLALSLPRGREAYNGETMDDEQLLDEMTASSQLHRDGERRGLVDGCSVDGGLTRTFRSKMNRGSGWLISGQMLMRVNAMVQLLPRKGKQLLWQHIHLTCGAFVFPNSLPPCLPPPVLTHILDYQRKKKVEAVKGLKAQLGEHPDLTTQTRRDGTTYEYTVDKPLSKNEYWSRTREAESCGAGGAPQPFPHAQSFFPFPCPSPLCPPFPSSAPPLHPDRPV